MTNANNHTKKLQLIFKVLRLIFPQKEIDQIVLDNPQKVTFHVKLNHTEMETIFEMVWDSNLNFSILKKKKRRVEMFPVEPSTWYKVGDLLKRNFMDVERLKRWD